MADKEIPHKGDEVMFTIRGKVSRTFNNNTGIVVDGVSYWLNKYDVTITKRANHPDNDPIGTVRGTRYLKLSGNNYNWQWWDLSKEKWALETEVANEKITTSIPELLAQLSTEETEVQPEGLMTCPCGHNCQYNIDENCCSGNCRCNRPLV